MTKTKLSKEELELLEAYDTDAFESDLNPDRRKYLVNLAEQTFKKDIDISIKISNRDLEALQRRALEEGLPYQSLVASILHKYISGGLKDVTANKLSHKLG
ncbi:MAG: hypothetical protein GX029_07505 [Pseudomonadaceae bacterium]|nr:hypothetical protein [Pseudomonadaceae bacterium]